MSGPTREQVLRMALEAGFPVMGPARADAAERFAALAYAAGQAAEREASEEYNKAYLDECAEMAKEAVESEREACAKVCDGMSNDPDDFNLPVECAAAIRARGAK